METESLLVRALLLLSILGLVAQQTNADDICGFFTAIPRGDWPETGIPGPDCCDGQTWSQRPLIPAPHRDDLCMGEYVNNMQYIFLEEEIQGQVTIAQLNYNGASTPTIAVLNGIPSLINAQLVRMPEYDNYWFLTVDGRQDYETLASTFYIFGITVAGVDSVNVQLDIVNIDDNSPVIHAFSNCETEELGEPRLTDCQYEVTDIDGPISTWFMEYRIDSDRGDDLIFGIHSVNVTDYMLIMTIEILQPLDFETSEFHLFSVTAMDSLPNNHTVTILVDVENIEHRPPRWIEIFSVQQFDEKTEQSFNVRAIDGDTGIDKPIFYRLDERYNNTFFSIETLEEGSGGGVLHVEAIDRDEEQIEVYQISLIAYKYDNESFSTEMPVVIIINDINDKIPEPLHDVYSITIPEETPLTLNFEEEFGFHDKDLGVHAQYTLTLESVRPAGAADAFYVAPGTGYQRQTFIMGTVNHNILDYENEEFQHIELKLVATELFNTSHVGEATIHIYLENWNDELPAFDNPVLEVSVDETEGAGFSVVTAHATDRDIDDWLTYTLLGNAVNFLNITETTGEVVVAVDDAFNYHIQNEIFVQVQVQDNLMEPYHTTTSQLIIRLNNINNTPPSLRLPRRSPEVEENVPQDDIITTEITATDPDTTAELVFEIDWDASYATKQGREADAHHYHECVEIETIPVGGNLGSVVGRIVVREIEPGVTIDYEEFEILYLTVRVVDQNTVEGGECCDELTLAIIIIDMNDNPPVWDQSTLDTQFRVRETSESGVVIGSVLARDIDGPLYNQIRYSIRPRGDTLQNLVNIDPITGQLAVDENEAIDADVPRTFLLNYTVIASDCCVEDNPQNCPPDDNCTDTEGEIEIEILDINNKIPQPASTEITVHIYENASSGDEVVFISATDLDRDEVHHTLNYQINYVVNPRLRDFFEIDTSTGQVIVNYTTDAVLDRDRGEDTHQMFIIVMDNFYFAGDGNRNQAENIEVTVILLDVNDNAPDLPPRDELRWSISESLLEGERLVPDIYAPDIDEPGTDNSRVAYEVLSLTAIDRDITPPALFNMVTVDYTTGELETVMPLRGYWGTYDIHILAFDHGFPQQSSEEVYELIIRPFNFHAPEFIFPQEGIIVRIAREQASVNLPLFLVNGDTLDSIEAFDEDGLDAGVVDYSVIGNDDALQYFYVGIDGTLVLTQLVTDDVRDFEVTIRATDRGTEPDSKSTDVTFNLIFVPIQAEPHFPQPDIVLFVMELEGGLEERHQLPLALDYKNHGCTNDCHTVYYHIIDGNDGGQFAVESTTNLLFLESELNRSESEQHSLIVVASNMPTPPESPSATSILRITVNVREANPRPRFVTSLYMAGISASDNINRYLFTVQATHTENQPVTYSIDWDTMEVDDTSLSGVASTAFRLNDVTGEMFLNMQPTLIMHGMFEFQVVASDGAETDRTEAKVFLISTQNRVYFLFVNDLETIQNNRDFIAQTFSTGFGMSCNIDDILPATDSDGTVILDRTEVRAHFIEDNVPVPAEQIEELRSDTQLLRSIQNTLSTMLINLDDFVTDLSPASTDQSQITYYVLIGLVGLLALLSLVVLLTCIFRTRSLKRRLEALSTTKFGSMESNLNRAGVTVPGTNKHAVEGSNPIWNEQAKAPDFDALSNDSGDSDLIGIEDMPQFFYNDTSPSDYNPGSSKEDAIPTHDNNFGFNTAFTPGFNKSQYNRFH